MMKKDVFNCVGVILAGGRAVRMQGKNKALQSYKGNFLFRYAYEAMAVNVNTVYVNVNLNQEVFLDENIRIFEDSSFFSNCGPLSGLATALSSFSDEYSHVLFSPCDTPLVPGEIFQQLIHRAQTQPTKAFYIETSRGAQPLHVVMPVAFLRCLLDFLEREQYKVMAFYKEIDAESIYWGSEDSFMNINYLEQLS
ncbi:molybdenum cofactor guanylyltransferase [Marinomonas algicola]|uniref:molybdenum cofactor guanylyltransferase n=1 Tax=Marinomonas algicola TaxID=2773454 RepID=UPI00174C3376|nr:molybdenum cofactor guanylyltransferase [Marinomonas algicola]